MNKPCFVLVTLALTTCLAPCAHSDTILNFESDPVGSLPPGWVNTGSAAVGVTTAQNHTGMIPPWSYPNFGSSGTKSLGMTVAAGPTNSTLGLNVSSGSTGEFRLNWSFFVTSGMSGTLDFKAFGSNSVAAV